MFYFCLGSFKSFKIATLSFPILPTGSHYIVKFQPRPHGTHTNEEIIVLDLESKFEFEGIYIFRKILLYRSAYHADQLCGPACGWEVKGDGKHCEPQDHADLHGSQIHIFNIISTTLHVSFLAKFIFYIN